MARAKKANVTKLRIIQVGTRMFLEKGYSNTSTSMLCKELEISPGNLTFHFATKEHLLTVLVDMLCDFQMQVMQHYLDEGKTSLMALCLELMTMAAICEESEAAKDFYISSYTHPMTLEIIRKNDKERAKTIFGEFCKDWTDVQFREAEVLVSGIEYGTLMTTESSSPLDMRISGALDGIMKIFEVPKETRKMKIEKVMAMDYRSIGRRILKEFIEYIETTNEQALEEMLKSKAKKSSEA